MKIVFYIIFVVLSSIALYMLKHWNFVELEWYLKFLIGFGLSGIWIKFILRIFKKIPKKYHRTGPWDLRTTDKRD